MAGGSGSTRGAGSKKEGKMEEAAKDAAAAARVLAAVERNLDLPGADDEGREGEGPREFPFAPCACHKYGWYFMPTFVPCSFTNPACLLGQHVTQLLQEDFYCGGEQYCPMERDCLCAPLNRWCVRRVFKMGVKGWAVCCCFSCADWIPCLSWPPVGWLFCIPHYSIPSCLATYAIRGRIVKWYKMELEGDAEKPGCGDKMGVYAPSCFYCCLLTQQVAFLEMATGKDEKVAREDTARREASERAKASASESKASESASESASKATAAPASSGSAPAIEEMARKDE